MVIEAINLFQKIVVFIPSFLFKLINRFFLSIIKFRISSLDRKGKVISIIGIIILVLASLILFVDFTKSDNPPEQSNVVTTRTGASDKYCIGRQCTLILYSGQMNYDNGSTYVPINITIANVSKTVHGKTYTHAVETGVYKAYFKKQFAQQDGVMYDKNDDYLYFQVDGLFYRDQNSNQFISGRKSIDGYSLSNRFMYENALGNNLDLYYDYWQEILKQNLNISSLNDLPMPENYVKDGQTLLELDFEIEYDNDVDLYINNILWNKQATKNTQSRIDFKKHSDNETIFYLPEPYAYDRNSSLLLNYSLKKTGNKLLITTQTPYKWLNSTLRNYPVRIDPTVVLMDPETETLEDTYVEGAFPAKNYGSSIHLMVGQGVATGGKEIAFIKFNIGDLKNVDIQKANLSLYVNGINGAFTIDVFHVYNQTWSEHSLNWTTHLNLASNKTYEDRQTVDTSGRRYNWSVRLMLQNASNSNWNNFSIKINSSDASSTENIDFYSKEYLGWRPALIVFYESRTSPNFTSLSSNKTYPRYNENINLSIKVQARFDLDTIIFSTNNSGSWINSSAYRPSITNIVYLNYSNLKISTKAGKRFFFSWYANDTSSNVNRSQNNTNPYYFYRVNNSLPKIYEIKICKNTDCANPPLNSGVDALNSTVNATGLDPAQSLRVNFTYFMYDPLLVSPVYKKNLTQNFTMIYNATTNKNMSWVYFKTPIPAAKVIANQRWKIQAIVFDNFSTQGRIAKNSSEVIIDDATTPKIHQSVLNKTSLYNDEYNQIFVQIVEDSTVELAKVEIDRPSPFSNENITMTAIGTTNNYTTSQFNYGNGDYNATKFYARDSSYNWNTTRFNDTAWIVGSRPSGTGAGGGGGGEPTYSALGMPCVKNADCESQLCDLSMDNQTGAKSIFYGVCVNSLCGNGICDRFVGEGYTSCQQDCTLVAQLKTGNLFKEAKVAQLAGVVFVIGAAVIVFEQQRRKKKKYIKNETFKKDGAK